MTQRPTKDMISHYRSRYIPANRKKKKEILDDFCKYFHYHRKSAIRLFHATIYKDPRIRRGRPRIYKPEELQKPLTDLWLKSNQLCSKLLSAALPDWLPFLDKETLGDQQRKLLTLMSPSTIDRLLRAIRPHHYRKRRCGTKPGSLLKNQIPIKTDNWDITQPGFVEADTVAHCGNSLSGNFIWSVNLCDIYSGWTESRAIWNKGSEGVLKGIQSIESTLPFSLQAFDCDNGSEFLNHHLVQYFSEHTNKVAMTRSRPYKKNDNAHIEQKNWTHVRQLFGYDRLDNPALVTLMNEIYSQEWNLYQNFFTPKMKLIKKEKINSKYRKKYDKPQTPYQRLLNSDHIPAEKKQQLIAMREGLNPFKLKNELEKKLRVMFKSIKISSNVRLRI